MAEGERPEPAGSHDWNKESSEETQKRQRAEQAREVTEWKQQDRERERKLDINSVIASLDQAANTPRYDPDSHVPGLDHEDIDRANIKEKLKYKRRAGFYSYMRDKHQAKTIGDVEEKLRQHQVDSGVVRL